MTLTEVGNLGYKLVIAPNFSALAAIKAMAEVFSEIRRTGTVAGVRDRCATFKEFTSLGGLEEFEEIDRRFGAIRDLEEQ